MGYVFIYTQHPKTRLKIDNMSSKATSPSNRQQTIVTKRPHHCRNKTNARNCRHGTVSCIMEATFRQLGNKTVPKTCYLS